MHLGFLDWAVIALYVAFAIAVGLYLRRRAGRSTDDYFLAGRSLPWWVVGTSMVATTFAADTPLVVTGWVRDGGIWSNWLWWCFAVGGMLTIFLFSRYWRRLGVMTQAELAELRYGGKGAAALRGTLGFFHAFLTNPIVLCWVLLAAAKISDVLFDIDKVTALAIACAICMSYSLLSGFWGVAITDLVQFALAMIGAIVFAVIVWQAVGGREAIVGELAGSGGDAGDYLAFLPHPGDGSWTEIGFWTTPLAAVAVYLGVSWWATSGVDGGPVVVQRIAASRSPAHGSVGTLWYNIANYALRPWMWIAVALASLLVIPHGEPLTSPVAGTVVEISESGDRVVIQDDAGARTAVEVTAIDGWAGVLPTVTKKIGDKVTAANMVDDKIEKSSVIARSDSEKAYVVMMVRYLPAGILGVVIASLLAAFMSTIDTHVNLASSYFINDLYRRFLRPKESQTHYVAAARFASVAILLLGAFLASVSTSISDLFTFFLAFLGGVGPVYLLRWLWWRVTMYSSGWSLGPFSPGGEIEPVGRLLVVVVVSLACGLLATFLGPRSDPAKLVSFYEKVRPVGAWGPVRALARYAPKPHEGKKVLAGIAGGLAMVWGLTLGIGWWLLGDPLVWSAFGTSAAGAVVVVAILPGLLHDETGENSP